MWPTWPRATKYSAVSGSNDDSCTLKSDGEATPRHSKSDSDLRDEKSSQVFLSAARRNKCLCMMVIVCITLGHFVLGFTSGFFGLFFYHHPDEHSSQHSQSCTSPATRREWRSLSHLEKDEYISAVKCLPTQPSILGFDHRLYNDFAFVHSRLGNYTQYTAGFFPWHRWYLHSYEVALRTRCNYSGCMPYLDWTLDWEDFHASPVWDPHTGFGGDGDTSYVAEEGVGKGHCVTDGPFAGLRPLYYVRDKKEGPVAMEHCLSRGMRTGRTLEYAMSKIQPAAVEGMMGRESYENFTIWLEKDTHKAMPFVVQGDFLAGTGPDGT